MLIGQVKSSYIITPQTCIQSASWRSVQRKGWRDMNTRSRSPLAQATEPTPQVSSLEDGGGCWHCPSRKLVPAMEHTRSSAFSIVFFAPDTVRKICSSTNKNAAARNWGEITNGLTETEELYKFFGLLLHMSLVSLPNLQGYWRENHILSVPIPAKVMTRDRFQSTLSDPEDNVQNVRKKGTTRPRKAV